MCLSRRTSRRISSTYTAGNTSSVRANKLEKEKNEIMRRMSFASAWVKQFILHKKCIVKIADKYLEKRNEVDKQRQFEVRIKFVMYKIRMKELRSGPTLDERIRRDIM